MKDAHLLAKDATGNFITYLINVAPVYAHHVLGRYDIGNLQSYEYCNDNFN